MTKAILIAPEDTAVLIFATMVASRGGNGAVTVMVYRTLIFDVCVLIPHCPRPNDDANSDNDDDDNEDGEVILSKLLLLLLLL